MQNGILDSFAYVPAMNNKLYVRCFYQYFLQDKSAHNEIRDSHAGQYRIAERRGRGGRADVRGHAREAMNKMMIPPVDKGAHGLQRPICFCTLLSSLTVAPLRLAHSPRAEANIFSANFLGTWRLEISAQARPQDEILLDVRRGRERSMR